MCVFTQGEAEAGEDQREEEEEEEDKNEEGGNDAVLVPPTNYSMVEDGIHRSAFPQPINFPFFRTLSLRSIIYLCPEPYPEENFVFLKANNIKLLHFGMEGGKTESSVSIPQDTIMEALKALIDVRNHPVLIHCHGGKHRTGCLVGCFRKLQNWRLPAVLEEYEHYAGIKLRINNIMFITSFDVKCLRQSLYSIIYQYHGYGSKKRRLLYSEENLRKPQIASS